MRLQYIKDQKLQEYYMKWFNMFKMFWHKKYNNVRYTWNLNTIYVLLCRSVHVQVYAKKLNPCFFQFLWLGTLNWVFDGFFFQLRSCIKREKTWNICLWISLMSTLIANIWHKWLPWKTYRSSTSNSKYLLILRNRRLEELKF